MVAGQGGDEDVEQPGLVGGHVQHSMMEKPIEVHNLVSCPAPADQESKSL